MVKPISVQPRIEASRSTRKARRRKAAPASVKPQLLKALERQPNVALPDFTALGRALRDHRSPYTALILKNVSPAAYHELKPMVASLSDGSTYACNVSEELDGDALTKHLATMRKDLQRLGKNQVGTLLVYWDGEGSGGAGQMAGLAALLGGAAAGGKSNKGSNGSDAGSEEGEDSSWAAQVASFVQAAHLQSPRTKIVIVTPRPALEDGDALKTCEVQDLSRWSRDLDETGRLNKAAQLAKRLRLRVSPGELKTALLDVPFSDLPTVIKYASVLQKRSGGSHLPELQAAVAEYWQQEPSEASTDLKPHLWDTRGAGFEKSYFGAPADVRAFVAAVQNHGQFGALNATLPHVLVLDASPASGTAAMASAIAGELGAACVRVEDVDLAKIVNDKGGLEALLDAANTYGRERNCPVVVYLSQLEAVLTLGMRGLHGIGKEPGREHLVVVAPSDELTDEVREHLQPHMHVASLSAPNATHLASFWRYYLAKEHPAHTLDDDAVARVAQASTGFQVEEVRDVLVRAGKLAFARANGGAAQITEADVLTACHEASEARRTTQPYLVSLTGEGFTAVGMIPPAVLGFVELLKHYDEAKAIDRNASKSLLLYGPAGVGKLRLAKAIADEIGAGLFALHKTEILHALSDEEVGLTGLLQRVNTWAQQQNKVAVVYLGDIESGLGAGANAEDSVGFNPVAAKFAQLAQQCGNHPDYKNLVLVAGTADSRVAEGSLPDAFQVSAEVRAPTTEALVGLFRRALAADHPAHAVDAEGLERIARYAHGSIAGFNPGAVERVLNRASRLVWQRPSEGPRRLEVGDVLRAIDGENERTQKPSFYS